MDILKHFFEEPEKEFHLREIARLSRLAPSTASKHLSNMAKSELLILRSDKGFSLFRSNTENTVYRDFKLFYNLLKIRNCGLIDFLAEEFNHPKCILLFGSFRKGENSKGSDIDIFIETPSKKETDVSKFEKALGHSIHLLQFSSSEIELMKTKNKEMLNSIINGISLYGYFEVFK